MATSASSDDGGGAGAVGGVSPEMAAAMVPAEMLHGDELIVLLTKPSPLFIVVTSLRFVIVVLLLAVLAGKWAVPTYTTANQVALVAVLLALGRLVWGLLVWTSHTYMLTNQRIITIKGVLNVTVVATSLRKVQRTTLYRPLWMRLFGLGTLGIATAATDTYDATWVMIGRPIETHESVVAAINKMQ